MTKKELIDLLSKIDGDDTRIFIRGYEGGLDDVSNIEIEKISLDINTEWYYGKHELSSSLSASKRKLKTNVKGIIIC
jgi:hypothetical protein